MLINRKRTVLVFVSILIIFIVSLFLVSRAAAQKAFPECFDIDENFVFADCARSGGTAEFVTISDDGKLTIYNSPRETVSGLFPKVPEYAVLNNVKGNVPYIGIIFDDDSLGIYRTESLNEPVFEFLDVDDVYASIDIFSHDGEDRRSDCFYFVSQMKAYCYDVKQDALTELDVKIKSAPQRGAIAFVDSRYKNGPMIIFDDENTVNIYYDGSTERLENVYAVDIMGAMISDKTCRYCSYDSDKLLTDEISMITHYPYNVKKSCYHLTNKETVLKNDGTIIYNSAASSRTGSLEINKETIGKITGSDSEDIDFYLYPSLGLNSGYIRQGSTIICIDEDFLNSLSRNFWWLLYSNGE